MKITFLGAAHEVTGSCTLLEVCGKRILVDCGAEQGEDIYENVSLPVAPSLIDAILVTHAHTDHTGKLPAMVAQGYKRPIYATEATTRLCAIMLRDSAHIQESEAEWKNRKAKRAGGVEVKPLYTVADAEQTLRLFRPYAYDVNIELFPGVSIRFRDAGHLLGSASIYITVKENGAAKTILFSGDLGNHSRPLIRDPQPAKGADYVVIESTYGDRVHGDRPDYVGQLTRILQDTFDRGGNVVIPCFAVGRTQEMLYLMRTIKTEHLLRGHEDFAVYVDSPMAVEATRIYADGLVGFYDDETLGLLARGIDPITFPGLRLSVTSNDSKQINVDTSPKVILSASGMCEAGRIRHHLKHNLWREDSTVLFVGYQSEGTVGRKLIDGAAEVKLFGERVMVRARIENLNGISGHADRDMMLRWLGASGVKPRLVFVNHGEDHVCDTFAREITTCLGYDAVAPFSGDVYDLATGDCLEKGSGARVVKGRNDRQTTAVFERLLAAGQRLLSLLQKCKGRANKELTELTAQIDSLCDRINK